MWDTVTILGWLNRLRAASQGSSLRHGFPRNGHSHQSVCPVFQGKTKLGLHQQTKQQPSINPSVHSSRRGEAAFWDSVTQCLLSPPPRCACGQLTTQHVAIPPGANSVEETIQLVQIDTPKDKWSIIKHTRTYPTDAFGVIEFQGGGFINKAMVRLCSPAFGGRNSKRQVNILFKNAAFVVTTPFPCSGSISESPMTPNPTTCCT